MLTLRDVLPLAVLSLTLLPALAASAATPPMPTEKAYHLSVPLVREGRAVAAIVPPPGDGHARLAAQIQAKLKELSGAEVPIREAKSLKPEEYRSLNMILLGNFANNVAVQPLYHQHYVMSDDEWPGAGGYELRTVHDPFGAGTCSVYLGASDEAGVAAATTAFLAMLQPGPTVDVPVTIKIVQGGQPLTFITPAAVTQAVDSVRKSGFRDVAARVCQAGLSYHATGDPGNAEIVRQSVPLLAKIVAGMPKIEDARGSVYLPTIWDLVEEAPVFSAADRTAIAQFMWEYANKCTNNNQVFTPQPTPEGNNWDARANWSAAQYFRKYYNLDVAGLDKWCTDYFTGQARFWKFENCPGYGSITHHDLTFYALSKPDWTYFENGNARRTADYGLQIFNNLGFPSGFGDISSFESSVNWPQLFLAAAWYYRDGRYRYCYDRLPDKAINASEYLYGRYLDNSVKPVEPTDLLGIKACPLPPWVHEHPDYLSTGTSADEVLKTETLPPVEKCFDKISFRDGFSPSQQYLLLGGTSHGYHAHPDANAIICYTDRKSYMLFDNGYFVPDTLEHNTIAIFRDGLSGPVPRLASLEQRVDLGRVGLCQTQVTDYNGMDWRRNLIWAKDKYFLCLDELEARQPGDYGLQCVFRTIGAVKLQADRACAVQSGSRFSLLNATGARLKTTAVNPPSPDRHAIVQSASASLAAGDRTSFINVFYSPEGTDDYPVQLVQAGPGAALVHDGSDVLYAGTRPVASGFPVVSAAMFAVSSKGFTLSQGTAVTCDSPWFRSDKPVNIEADLAAGKVRVEATEATVVSLKANKAGAAKPTLDGKATTVQWAGGLVSFAVPAGAHDLTFAPALTASAAPLLLPQWQKLLAAHRARVAELAKTGAQARGLRPLWDMDLVEGVQRDAYVPVGATGAARVAVPDLARIGKASYWTKGSEGCNPGNATDGDPESYSAVSSGDAHTSSVPKDLGVEWDQPQTIAQVRVSHYNETYPPAMDGQDLQVWDGKDWVSVDDQITGADTPQWVHTFKPVTTTRVRLLVTKFAQNRTAIRSFEAFAVPVELVKLTVRTPVAPAALKVATIQGKPTPDVVVATGKRVRVLDGGGQLVWQVDLPANCEAVDAYDLNKDGQMEVAAAAGPMLYCFDARGGKLWEALCAKDKYFPEIEPQQGPFRVIKCDDINADGFGEIIAGSGNWFSYAFDHTGKQLWGTLNWAHQPTSIATVDVDGTGKKAALIGNTYCSANLFAWDGKVIGDLAVGYHAAAMTAAAGSMNHDGKIQLIAGSRVGGICCKTFGTEDHWELDTGAEVTATQLVDLDGDGKLELLVSSRNAYVMALDARGARLWQHNCGDSVLGLATGDVNGDGKPEIAVGRQGGAVLVLDAQGHELGLFPLPGDVAEVALADLDGDGQAEIIAGVSDGRLYALKAVP